MGGVRRTDQRQSFLSLSLFEEIIATTTTQKYKRAMNVDQELYPPAPRTSRDNNSCVISRTTDGPIVHHHVGRYSATKLAKVHVQK